MPPRIQPKTFILTFKTHKLAALTTVRQPEKTTIRDLKAEALNAMKADVLSTDRDGDIDMLSSAPIDPEWVPPVIDSVNDFELCRTVRERGRPTGQYETLSPDDIVKETLVNWECLFIQFKDESGGLLPIKVSLPALVEDDDEEPDHSVQKGKRKAAPTDGSES